MGFCSYYARRRSFPDAGAHENVECLTDVEDQLPNRVEVALVVHSLYPGILSCASRVLGIWLAEEPQTFGGNAGTANRRALINLAGCRIHSPVSRASRR